MRRAVTIVCLMLIVACTGRGPVPEPPGTMPGLPPRTGSAARATTQASPSACLVTERVTGTAGRWTPAALPAEVVVSPGAVTVVSAAGARIAWAVGHSGSLEPGPASHPFALAWDGVRWTSTPVPPWSGGFVSVTAVDARVAWAVGTETLPDGGERSHLVRWDGSSWREAWPAPESGVSSSARLRQVSADRCGRVYLVGGDRDVPLIAQWDGRAWHRLPFPASSGNGAEAGLVSFRPGTRVWVGVSWTGGGHAIISWDGRAWRTEQLVGGWNVGLSALTVFADDQVWFVSNRSWVGGPFDRPAPPNQVFEMTVSGSGPLPSTLGWTAVTGVSGHADPEWVTGSGGVARWDGRRWVSLPGVLPRGFLAEVIAPVPGTDETWLAAAAAQGMPGANTHRPLLLRFVPGSANLPDRTAAPERTETRRQPAMPQSETVRSTKS
jgi:hypothetical protein